MYRLQ